MALGLPGEYHDPLIHNMLTEKRPLEQRVSREDTNNFS